MEIYSYFLCQERLTHKKIAFSQKKTVRFFFPIKEKTNQNKAGAEVLHSEK